MDAGQLASDPASLLLALSRRRGDIFRFRGGPEPSYLVNRPDYIEHVLVSNASGYSKATSSNEMFRKGVADGLLTQEGERWRLERQLVQPFFRSLPRSSLDRAVSDSLERLAARWGPLAGTGERTDLAHGMLLVALELTVAVLFGAQLGDCGDELVVSLEKALRLITAPAHPEFQHARRTAEALLDAIIESRQPQPEAGNDLLSGLLSCRRNGKPAPDEPRLFDQIATYLLAGAETTGRALAWTLLLVSAHPRERDRLERELSAGPRARHPLVSDLRGLPLTRMIVQESLRLYPPGWILGRRALYDDHIGEIDLEPGASVALSPYTMHRHPRYWNAPDEFRPDRFQPTRTARWRRFSYFPFGGGPRRCIGAQLAIAETMLVVASVTQRYHLTPVCQPEPEGRFVLRPRGGMPVTVERRPG